MSRTNKRNTRRQGAAAQLLAFGIFVVLLPLFIGESQMGALFQPYSKWGWLMIFGGGVLLWLSHKPQLKTKQSSRPPSRPTKQVPAGSPSDRVATVMDDLLHEQRPATRAPRDAYYSAKEQIPSPPTAWSRAVFDVIEWRRFEAVVEMFFEQAGFTTKAQSHGADQGVDVWLYGPAQPDQPIGLVQCKHWQKNVGVDKVRELRGVMAAHNIKRGHFAATASFTPEAKAFGLANNISLLDIDALLAVIMKRSAEQQNALLAVALEGEYWRPTCASCGVKMVERERKTDGRPFWGCVNYPRCSTRIGMRQR